MVTTDDRPINRPVTLAEAEAEEARLAHEVQQLEKSIEDVAFKLSYAEANPGNSERLTALGKESANLYGQLTTVRERHAKAAPWAEQLRKQHGVAQPVT